MNSTGNFSAVWPALTVEAKQEIESTVATCLHAEHVGVCRRLRELVRAHATRSEAKRLMAFVDVLERADLLDVAGEA
jgi:hypothetical protein